MRVLTTADFGILSLIISFTTIISAIVGLGLRQFLSIHYFHCNTHERATVIQELITIYSIWAMPCMILLAVLYPIISAHIFFNTVPFGIYLLILTNIFFLFFIELYYQILQYEKQAQTLTKLQITVALINTGFTLFFLWIIKTGVFGIVFAQLIGTMYALSVLAQNSFIRFCFEKTLWPKAKRYIQIGLPFIPGIMCSWILASADRWFLGHYGSLHEVGIYSVADLFAQLFNSLVLVPWAGSYLPYIMEQYKNNENHLENIEYKNQQVMWACMVGFTAAVTLLYTAGLPLARTILPPNYYESLNYVLILLYGQIFLLGTYFGSALIQFKKHTHFLATALLIPSVLNVLLNVALIPTFTIYGAAYATLAAYGIYFLIIISFNKSISI